MVQITTLDHIIDAQALTLTSPTGAPINIRPKTCQLLIVLLKNHGNVVSKNELLGSVWGGSVVDEQVVFQSIKELRKIFADCEVIKTLPKQGYLWLHNADIKDSTITTQKTRKKPFGQGIYIISLIGLLSIILLSYLSLKNIKSATDNQDLSVNGSVIILPVENLMVGNVHSWVRLGMMDQIIQGLPNNSQAGVLQTDYVLEVLKRADVSLHLVTRKNIPAIFSVSGAELIVATKLSGSPSDYQLSYTFYRRQSQKRGVLFAKNTDALVDHLTPIIAAQIGNTTPLNSEQYIADFNDELLGAAVDLLLQDNQTQAIPLLKSVINNNPNNLTAQRLLIQSYLNTKAYELAAIQLKLSLSLARKLGDANELIRLLYFEGIHRYIKGEQSKSERAIKEGLNIAGAQNDWLFKAYLTELKAQFAMKAQQFKVAEELIEEALGYHQVLRCPLGETQSWLFMGELARAQNQPIKQKAALDRAYDIAVKRNLTEKIEEIEKLIKNYKEQ